MLIVGGSGGGAVCGGLLLFACDLLLVDSINVLSIMVVDDKFSTTTGALDADFVTGFSLVRVELFSK